jgi:uncharacterized protein YdbL (DUF1318 family)
MRRGAESSLAPRPLLHPINTTRRLLGGVSRETVYKGIRNGSLEVRYVLGRTMITDRSIRRLAGLPDSESEEPHRIHLVGFARRGVSCAHAWRHVKLRQAPQHRRVQMVATSRLAIIQGQAAEIDLLRVMNSAQRAEILALRGNNALDFADVMPPAKKKKKNPRRRVAQGEYVPPEEYEKLTKDQLLAAIKNSPGFLMRYPDGDLAVVSPMSGYATKDHLIFMDDAEIEKITEAA